MTASADPVEDAMLPQRIFAVAVRRTWATRDTPPAKPDERRLWGESLIGLDGRCVRAIPGK